jgi:hypothetical protein
LFSQVLTDLKGECKEALEAGDAEQVEDLRQKWPKRARALLAQGQSAASNLEPSRKRFRVETSHYMAALDNYLQCLTGVGLSHFTQPAALEDRGSPWTWPHLVVSPDQGTDGVAGLNWFIHGMHGNCDPSWDHSHGVWNDWKRALKASKLWYKKQILVVLWNIRHGPWNNKMWDKKLKGAMDEYFSVASPGSCPIWQWLLPRLLHDRGMSDMASEENISEQMWEIVKASRRNVTKGTKVNLTRWFGAVQRSQEFDILWHEELLNFMMLCFTTGIIESGSFAAELSGKLKKDIEVESEAKHEGGMKAAGQDTLAKLRASAKNTYHLGLYILLDPENQRLERIETALSLPLWSWHGRQSTVLKSCEGTSAWTRTEVAGDCMQSLNQILEKLGDPGVLEHCGFSLSLSPAEMQLPLADHYFYTEQLLANTMGRFALNLIAARVRRNIWFWFGWPSKLCLFTHPDEDTRQAALKDFLTKAELFDEICKRKEAFWKKAVTRNAFNTVSVQQIRGCLAAEGNTLSEMMVEWAAKRGLAVTVSVASEHCFKVLRRHEEKGSNGSFNSKTAWAVLVESKLLHEVHSYKEIPFAGELLPTGESSYLPDDTFDARQSKASLDFRKIQGTSRTPAWFTNSPDTNMLPHCDFEIALVCQAKGEWQAASRSWLCCLGLSTSLLLKRKGASDQGPGANDGWYFSLGQNLGGCITAWPADLVDGPGKTVCYSPRPLQSPNDIKFLVILAHEEWLGKTFAWKPPSVQLREGKRMPMAGLLAVPTAKAEPLIKCAARNCFWDLGKVPLRKLATNEGVEHGRDATLFQLLHGLVAKCAHVAEEKVFEILNLRLHAAYDACEELFMEEDCVNLVAEEDQGELVKTIKETKEAEEEFNTFKKELQKARTSAKARSKSSAKSTAKRTPLKVPTGDITLDMAKQMVPPTCIGIKLDSYGGRWWAQTATGECKSRSWQLHGFNESCRLVVAWLWSECLGEDQLDSSACPIEGLFRPNGFGCAPRLGAGAGGAGGSAAASSAG